MKILNPHAQPVEAQLPQRLQVPSRGHSRIDLDSHLSVRGKREALARGPEQILDLLRRKIRRCPATPMELHHLAVARNSAAHAPQFALQHPQVRRRNSLVLLDDYVASAEQAQAFAEGNMHV